MNSPITELIAQNNRKEALSQLLISTNNSFMYEEVIILNSIYNELKRKEIKGILSNEKINIEYNNLRNKMLLVNKILLEKNLLKTENISTLKGGSQNVVTNINQTISGNNNMILGNGNINFKK